MAFGSEGGFGVGPGDEIEGLGEILPAMQGMLQSLLSKELLYPSIKEIVNKVQGKLFSKKSKFVFLIISLIIIILHSIQIG